MFSDFTIYEFFIYSRHSFCYNLILYIAFNFVVQIVSALLLGALSYWLLCIFIPLTLKHGRCSRIINNSSACNQKRSLISYIRGWYLETNTTRSPLLDVLLKYFLLVCDLPFHCLNEKAKVFLDKLFFYFNTVLLLLLLSRFSHVRLCVTP